MAPNAAQDCLHVCPETRDVVRMRLDGCLKVLEIFEWIINSFVLGKYLPVSYLAGTGTSF